MKYNLCDYWDVWGNSEEGYEINNWSYPYGREFKIEADLSTDQKIIDWLVEEGYFIDEVTTDDVVIDDEGNGMIMIYAKELMKPICCFEYRDKE